MSARRLIRNILSVAICCLWARGAYGLDPRKSLTQYTRTNWTQKDGLPEDVINAIVQTTDGYLWLGTDEGLARFDGYDFTLFTQDTSKLPSNSVTALAAGPDGSLWVGTAKGLAHYKDRQFHVYTTNEGLPDNFIAHIYVDHTGIVWTAGGGSVARLDNKKITAFVGGKDIPFSARTVYEDRHHVVWVAGFSGLAEFVGGRFVSRVTSAELGGNLLTVLVGDNNDNLWMGGGKGIARRSADGKVTKFETREGLPDVFTRALWVDHHGSLWAGTNAGLARLGNNRFTSLADEKAGDLNVVWCLYEDREGNVWVGANTGLSRLRDDVFTSYGRSEGMPGDDPNTLFQDHLGRLWVGFHNSGLMLFSPGGNRVFTTRDGLPSNEIFSIRERRDGNLLLGTRGGVVTMRGTAFSTYRPTDANGRTLLLDALEDSSGNLWLATQSGLAQLRDDKLRIVVPGGPFIVDLAVVLAAGSDGAIWAGTSGRGLWRIQGETKRQFTTADGLSSDQIHSLYQDRDGTLWIATFGGGLNAFRRGNFVHFAARDGLPSDNISHITDDGESLWLSTTRGICRVSKQQLRDFSDGKIKKLQPTNYGVEDGLRSAQLSFGYIAGGGSRTSDGRVWFPTTRGIAVIDPHERQQSGPAPTVFLVDGAVDGKAVDFSKSPQLQPGSDRIQIRYSAIHLSAPERIQYSHKLEGLDQNWVQAGGRREINYNSLAHGKYRFLVRAELPGGLATENAYAFELLPEFYETTWFRLLSAVALVGGAWGIYQLRLRRLRHWFALVLEERARLAREIHDTLAQGFIGISSQLDAVAMALPEDLNQASQDLALAQRMARYGITEARRSVVDLRASVLEGQNLGAALHSGAQIWTAGSGVDVDVDVSGAQDPIPDEAERHLLRIAQEAVTNAVKHAGASKIWVSLQIDSPNLCLRIIDNGSGFELQDAFSSAGGHFGLIGMRERAERLGGDLQVATHPGGGTKVEVKVQLP